MTHEPGAARATVESTPWWWQWFDAEGAVIEQQPRQEFGSRADAESWLGEAFGDLADEGVDAVTLVEGDREVFGPMSLGEG